MQSHISKRKILCTLSTIATLQVIQVIPETIVIEIHVACMYRFQIPGSKPRQQSDRKTHAKDRVSISLHPHWTADIQSGNPRNRAEEKLKQLPWKA